MENYRGINADSISVEDSNAFGSLTGSHFLQPIEGWTVTDVVQWLEENGFGRFCELFIKHDITGDVLLDLNYTYLKDMGVNLVGDRARILQAIKQKLRPPRPATIIDPNIVVPSFNGDRSILQMPGKMNQRPRNASLRDYADGGAVFPDLIMDSHIFSPISRNSTPERAATPEQSADLASSSASGKASTGQADYPSSHNAFSGIAPYTVKKSPSSGMIIPQTSLLETPLQQPESYQSDNGGPIQPSYVRSFSRAKSNPSLVSPVLTIAPRSSSIKAADNPSQPVDDSPPTQTASEPSNGPPLSPGREIYIQLFGEQEGNRMSDKVYFSVAPFSFILLTMILKQTRNRAVQISPPVKKPVCTTNYKV